jgi:hypothetical protein
MAGGILVFLARDPVMRMTLQQDWQEQAKALGSRSNSRKTANRSAFMGCREGREI